MATQWIITILPLSDNICEADFTEEESELILLSQIYAE
jgi:hypothetical protein